MREMKIEKWHIAKTRQGRICSLRVEDMPRGCKYQVIGAMSLAEAVALALKPASSNSYPYHSA